MTHADPPPPVTSKPRRSGAQVRRNVVRAAGLCAVLAVVIFLSAVVGFRQGWLAYGVASGGLVGLAVPALALLAVVFGVVGLVFAFAVKPREGLVGSLSAIAIGALTFAVWSTATAVSAKSPPVHDVATDWTDPPMFSQKVLDARGEHANPVELAPVVPEGPRGAVMSRPVAMVNAQTCRAAAPLILTTTPAAAYAALKTAVAAEKMAILTDDPAGGRLEASAARGLWGVRDDLVGRVRPEGAGARIDLRSIARAGLNDGGANCARITRVRERLAG